MFRSDCIYCLCKTCTRGSCRYPADICFSRCCRSGRPLTYCFDYSSKFRGKRYVINKKILRSSDFIKKMSVSDLIEMVVNIIDEKRD